MDSLAASARDTYDREIRLRILPSLGNLDVRDIIRAHVQRMMGLCATEAVAKKAVNTLKALLNEARADELIAVDPTTLRYLFSAKGKARDNGLVIKTCPSMRPAFGALAGWDNDGTCAKLAVTGLLMGLYPEECYRPDWGLRLGRPRGPHQGNLFADVQRRGSPRPERSKDRQRQSAHPRPHVRRTPST